MTGAFMRLDPSTGNTKVYKVPGVLSIRGLAVDPQDNIWVSRDQGHSLVELDQKTDTITQHYPPTHNAGVSGLVSDKRTGEIWFSDFNGNNITRFNPETKIFVEYPIPTQNAFPRYIGLDPKGRVWFTESWAGKIGVLDPGIATGKVNRGAQNQDRTAR
jgi:virginiamycin B lyase